MQASALGSSGVGACYGKGLLNRKASMCVPLVNIVAHADDDQPHIRAAEPVTQKAFDPRIAHRLVAVSLQDSCVILCFAQAERGGRTLAGPRMLHSSLLQNFKDRDPLFFPTTSRAPWTTLSLGSAAFEQSTHAHCPICSSVPVISVTVLSPMAPRRQPEAKYAHRDDSQYNGACARAAQHTASGYRCPCPRSAAHRWRSSYARRRRQCSNIHCPPPAAALGTGLRRLDLPFPLRATACARSCCARSSARQSRTSVSTSRPSRCTTRTTSRCFSRASGTRSAASRCARRSRCTPSGSNHRVRRRCVHAHSMFYSNQPSDLPLLLPVAQRSPSISSVIARPGASRWRSLSLIVSWAVRRLYCPHPRPATPPRQYTLCGGTGHRRKSRMRELI